MVIELFIMKANKEKISMLTAYDFTMAKILDRSGVDVLLVGIATLQAAFETAHVKIKAELDTAPSLDPYGYKN